MAGAGPRTSEQLAERTRLNERYAEMARRPCGRTVRALRHRWATYPLPDEHAAVLADPDAPTYAVGTFRKLQPLYGTADALPAFRTGEGVAGSSTARSSLLSFDVATAQDFPGGEYDVITFFDFLDDLGDPGGALRRAAQTLARGLWPRGTRMRSETTSGRRQCGRSPVSPACTASTFPW